MGINKTMFHAILFDLDGTLTDPGIGITNSVAHALRRFGITPPKREALFPFIGPPLKESFAKFYGFSPEMQLLAVRYYREYFAERGIFENRVYPGVPETLSRLKKEGITLGVATSKPDHFARIILDHFGLAPYFDLFSAATMAETRTAKGEVIRYALSNLPGAEKMRVLMVGDRENDILGARENRIVSAGVLYGYGSREELQNAGADYLIERPEELIELAIGEKEKNESI